ncbi:MAG: MerR family DNA-binding transcriptional regulator [Oscillospiraceae bacterium]|jgi:DNA-binding transcriptional MerR regulator|nr:MerR family DNA-binding transcriptional regulator [Oscillospiraceae bacterium]
MNGTDLLSIKAFAELTGMNQSTLRYYDKIGLFSPVKRGENGYRYYSPQQTVTVNLVNVLNDLQTSLKDIGEQEKSRTPESILELLTKQETKFDNEMRRLHLAYSITHVFRNLIQEGIAANEYEISDVKSDALPLILGAINDFSENRFFYETFIRFCQEAKSNRVNLSYPVGGFFNSIDDFVSESSQPARFFSLDPAGLEEKAAGRYLVGYTRGYYGEMGDVGQRLLAYAEEHKLSFTGPLYVIYLHDEISEKDTSRYLAQVSVSVAPKRAKRGVTVSRG